MFALYKKIILSFLSFGLFLSFNAAASTYTFEGLSTGSLVGQDNWTNVSGDNLLVRNGSGINTSLVATNSGAASVASPDWARRQNDLNFSLPAFTGTETSALLEIDLHFADDPKESFWYYLGNSANTNLSPWLGIATSQPWDPPPSGVQYFFFRSADASNSLSAVPVSVSAGDWLTLRLDMNMAANSGAGVGNMSFRNLTQGDTGYTAIAGLQNLDLGLDGITIDPTSWDSMYLRSDLNATLPEVDNLTAVSAVPLPAALPLFLAGLGFIGYRARRSMSDGNLREGYA